MFNAFVPNHNVTFTFRHQHIDPKAPASSSWCGKPIQAITTCFLEIDGVPNGAFAACSALDRFDKEVGRKLALTRALKAAGAPKDIRTAVWDRYFGRDFEDAMYKELFVDEQ